MDDKSLKTLIQNNKGFEFNQIFYRLESKADFKVPDQFTKDFILIEKKWNSRERNDALRNQDNLCVSNYHIKDKKIYLNLCEAKYIERQVFSECFSMMNSLEQDMFLADWNAKKIEAPMSLKAQITIITKDNKLLVIKRSSKVSMNKNKFDFSISKSAKPEDIQPHTFQPFNTVIRALKEELNINLSFKEAVKNKIIKISEIYLKKESFAICYHAEVDLRKADNNLTSTEILNIYKDAKNSWEISEVHFIENNPAKIKKAIKQHESKATKTAVRLLTKYLES